MVVGLLAGFLTQRAKLPHLLSSILVIGLFHGITQYVLGGSFFSVGQFALGDGTVCGLRIDLFVLLILFICLFLVGTLFFKSQLGMSLFIYGDNPQFFQNYNISTTFVLITGLCVASSLAGLSGYLDVQASGFVDMNMGAGRALFCITSLILGKAFVKRGGGGTVLVPFLGVAIYFILQQALLRVGFDLRYFTMVQAAVVLCVLVLRHRPGGDGVRVDNLGV